MICLKRVFVFSHALLTKGLVLHLLDWIRSNFVCGSQIFYSTLVTGKGARGSALSRPFFRRLIFNFFLTFFACGRPIISFVEMDLVVDEDPMGLPWPHERREDCRS